MSIANSYSYDYYLRNSYSSNRDARKDPMRKNLSGIALTKADSSAMKKIAEKMRSLDYSTDNSSEISKNIKVFIATYNNLVDSTSTTKSTGITTAKKHMLSLTKDQKDALSKIGINISSNGSLKLDKTTFGSAKLDDIKKVFSSDSEYMTKLSSYAKSISRKATEQSTQQTVQEPPVTTENITASSGNGIDVSV